MSLTYGSRRALLSPGMGGGPASQFAFTFNGLAFTFGDAPFTYGAP